MKIRNRCKKTKLLKYIKYCAGFLGRTGTRQNRKGRFLGGWGKNVKIKLGSNDW